MRYFIGFFATVLLIIIVIILIFRGGGSKPPATSTSKPLDSYATTDAEVRMTLDGPVNADSQHNQVRVSVDHNNVTFEQIQGYEGHVVKQTHYPNNVSAYETFLLALSRAGFTQGDKSPALRDERGYCAQGVRYIFELNQNGNSIERFWTSTCGSPRSYLGLRDTTVSLFQAQVPDYADLTADVNL